MGLLLYILSQLALYGLLFYVGWRIIKRQGQAMRQASLTEAPEHDDYAPEPVNAAFIARVTSNRRRSIHRAEELELAAALVRWNPAGLRGPVADSYDNLVPPVLAILDETTEADAVAERLGNLLTVQYGHTAAELNGMANYLVNWARTNHPA